MAYKARKSGVKSGERVSPFARQQNLFAFDDGATVSDYTNATIMMLADIVNGAKVTELKKTISIYNDRARDAASGQSDIFSAELKTKEDILKEVNELLNYGTEEAKESALSRADASRRASSESVGAESVEQDGTAGVSREGSADVEDSVQAALAAAEQETNTEPTDAQKEAGNYKKGHVKIDGYNITIENPKGSERSGQDKDGKKWSITMNNTYGYILGTEGVDGDHIDVFLSDNPSEGNVYIVDQVNADGSFDEHKVMYGFPDIESARKAYLSNYEEGWQGLGNITGVSKEEFKKWVDSSHRKTKPFAEYKNVKVEESNTETEEEVLPYNKENSERLSLESEKNADNSAVGYSVTLESKDGTLQRSIFYDGRLIAIQWQSGERIDSIHDVLRSAYNDAPAMNCDLYVPMKVGANESWEIDGRDVLDADHGDIIRFHDEQEMIDFYLKNRNEIDRRNETMQPHSAETRETALRDGLIDKLRSAGIEVITDEEEAQRVLDAANGKEKAQRKIDKLAKAANVIRGWLKNDVKGKVFKIELPVNTLRMIHRVMGRDFESHNITSNGIRHGLKNHGVGGNKLTEKSIPVRNEDAELIPYIMTAPDYVEKSSTDITGRESLRFYKSLSNGYVVVVEKEYKNSPDDMETITMWAEMSSSAATNARRNAPDTHVQNAILSTEDAAKIRKDAETAIKNDEKVSLHKVFHGSGNDFERFDHSHMGEGEGAQAYGWGTYVTEVEGIGKTYANASSRPTYKGYDRETLDSSRELSIPHDEKIAARILLKNLHTNYSDALERTRTFFKTRVERFDKRKDWTNRDFMDYFGCSRSEVREYREESKRKVQEYTGYLEALNKISETDIQKKERVLYTVEIPEDAETYYLDYTLKMGDQQDILEGVDNVLYAQGWHREELDSRIRFTKGQSQIILTPNQSGADLYAELEDALGSDKLASDFLHDEVGVTGMKYPAEYRSGGRSDGASNYVIFDENDLKITDKIKFLRTDSGEVYGFTKDGKIYIDPRKATAETPVHEFTHLWADGLRKVNPKAWERLKGELEKEKDLFDYVKSLYPELSGDDLIDEVFAHFSGRRGAERLRSEQKKMMQKANGVFDKAKITTMFDKLRNMLHNFWAQARDLFAGKTEGIEKLSAEDFADMALADLIKGEKPLVEGKKETRFNKAAGLDVRTYDNSNQQTRDEERERVTKEAVRERDDILFRNDDVSEYSFRTLRSDRFYNGISNSDAFAELLDENTSWVDGSLKLLRALKKRFGGEVVSASSGAKYALEHGLVPVPDGKYSGKDGEYHHIEFESDNGERFVESVPFVDAESVGDDYGIRYSESDGVSARADMDRAHDVAEEWTEKLNLNDDVQIVDELTREMVDELMPNASEEVKEKALKAKGWFNEKTGKIVIAVGNHRNAEDVMRTILHEGVAHYGLRKLFGENFNTFLDNVYASADASVRKRIDVLQENKGYGRREAVEEYLAGLAEVTDFESVVSRTWWEKVKSLFADMLNSIGLSGFADNSLPLSDNELRYILWRSYDNLKSDNDVFRQAKDIAMQSELKVGNYDESKDATLGDMVSGDRQLRDMSDKELDSEYMRLLDVVEKPARIDKLRSSKPVEIKPSDYDGKYKLNAESAQKWIKDNLRGKHVINDTGETVEVSKIGAEEVTSHNRYDEAHLKSISKIPSMLENAVFLGEEANTKGNRKFDSYRYYAVGLNIDGVDYTAKIVIGVKQGKKYYDHRLTQLEKSTLIDMINQPASGFTTAENASLPPYSNGKDKRLLSILQVNVEEILQSEQKMREILDEMKRRRGYDSNTDYQGSLAFNGAAPSRNAYFDSKEERMSAFKSGEFEGDYSLGDYMDNGLDNNDLGWQHANPIAASGRDKATLESIRNLMNVVKNKDRRIKMYRAVDASIKENKFRNGDWITPSREYAERHIGLQEWKNGRVIEEEVSVDDIWWNGDDINE